MGRTVAAASREGGAGTARAGTTGPRVRVMSVLREISPVWVSEGGLEHPFGWYITETVIYHHYKLTHRGQPDQQLADQDSAGAGQSRNPG